MSRTDARGQALSSGTSAARKRLLVVDDEPLIVEMLSDHLRGEYEVDTALDGVQALTAVVRQRPDVVLLDINMPRQSGVEVLKDIKQIDESITVVMVTGNAQVALVADALKGGAVSYIPKPVDLRYLDHIVAAALDISTPAAHR